MKVMLVNGSPRPKGCTYTALSEAAGVLEAEGIQTEIFQLGSKPIQGCIACNGCDDGSCVFKGDTVSAALVIAKECDGFIFGSPVYYAAASGQITSFLNRLFYSGGANFAYKPGAAIVSCRRAGSTAALEQLNKYMVISQMLLVGSQYWPMVHGNNPVQVRRDLEGMQTVRTLGRNMAWLLKCLEAGRNAGIGLPEKEAERQWTNFIRE